MPRVIRESFNESEAENSKTASKDVSEAAKNASERTAGAAENANSEANSNASSASIANNASGASNASSADKDAPSANSSDPSAAVVRRRRGRRVTRGAGAAGEAMELKVEDLHKDGQHAVPTRTITSLLFQEPVIPVHVKNRDDEDSRNSKRGDGAVANSSDSSDYSDDYSMGDSFDDLRDDLRGETRNRRSDRNSRSDKNDRNNRKNRDERGGRNNRNNRDESSNRSERNNSSERNNRNSRNDTRENELDDTREITRESTRETSGSVSRRSDRDANNREMRNSRDLRNSRDSRDLRDSRDSRDSEVEDDFDIQDIREDSPRKQQRSRRSRRLNAVERRAAAEVEQIEEDLAYDDIVYAPIDTRIDETLDVSDILASDNADRRSRRRGSLNSAIDEDDDDEGMMTRRRRRRRSSSESRDANRDASRDSSRRAGRNASRNANFDDNFDDNFNNKIDDKLDAVSPEDCDLIPDPDELRAQDEEETLYTRRRRRRRSKSFDDTQSASNSASNSASSSASSMSRSSMSRSSASSASSAFASGAEQSLQNDLSDTSDDLSSRRSRKQQYIDEITDIEGSTRLEAKRQRRRDNRRERSRQNLIMEQDFLARRENVERLMVVRERDRHTQISVIEDNILVEHYVSDIQEVATVGNIYLGRIQNVLPSMEAAFVDIGQARNGVLYAGEVNWDMARLEGQPRRIELAFKSGDPVLVQVTKDPIGHKGARLTSQVTLAGRFLVLVPSGGMTGVSRKLSDSERSRLRGIVSKIAPKDMGVIIRTAADGASEEAIQKDLESLTKQWERIESKRQEYLHGKRPKLLQGEPDVAIRVVRDIFNDDFQKLIVEGEGVYHRIDEYLEMMAPDLRSKIEYWDPADHEGKDVFDKWQIDSQLRKGMERQVYLPAGGSIVIDRTEAMTTIDVNTGRFIGRGKSLEETVTRCNLEASEEIARQLRLRDIGGMVMIDYVDMVMPANRDLVLRRLLECLARDRTKHQVAEVTSLGLVQMTRKRVGQGLVEAFSEECPMCKGRGFILHDEPTVSSEYADPYALKGGDPFVKTNKYGHGSATEQPAPAKQGSSADVRAKLARIAAASAINDSSHKSDETVFGAEFADNLADADVSKDFAENAEYAESTEHAENVETTESVESAESAEAVEKVESAENVETTETTETTESSESSESAESAENNAINAENNTESTEEFAATAEEPTEESTGESSENSAE